MNTHQLMEEINRVFNIIEGRLQALENRMNHVEETVVELKKVKKVSKKT